MTNRMAYVRGLGLAALALGLMSGTSGCGDDGGTFDPDAGFGGLPDDVRLEEIYVAGDFGLRLEEGGTGLPENPLRSVTEALQLRASRAAYGSADEIVLLTSNYTGATETFPIVVPRGVTVRGGAGTLSASRVNVQGSTEPAFRLNSGARLENMTIQYGAEVDACEAELYLVLVDTGEAGFDQVVIRDVVFEGGSPCHAQVGIGPRTDVLIDGRSEFRLDGRAAAIRTLENTVETSIQIVGESQGNCTGVRVQNAGPRQPAMFFRGDNEVLLDSMCFRPTGEPGVERTAIQIRGPIDATFEGIEIDTSDGTNNGEFFSYGIQHIPDAPLPTSAVTRVIDPNIEALEACIAINGGMTEVTGDDPGLGANYTAFLRRCNYGVRRTRGSLMMRNVDMSEHGESGIRLEGPAEGTIDLGTESDPGNLRFSNQTPNGRSGDLSIILDDSVDPPTLTSVDAFGQAWTPVTVGELVICRTPVQQEVFNIDSRQEGVDVTFNQGEEDRVEVCEGYQPPSDL